MAVAAASLLVAACSDDDGGGVDATVPPTSASTTAIPTTTEPPPPPPLDQVALSLTEVAQVEQPTAMTSRAGDDALYLAEKAGRVRVLRDEVLGTLLDVRSDVTTDANEQGLLGLAFSPDGGRFYAHYSDRAGDTAIDEWTVGGDGQLSQRRRILSVRQPFGNHNGGTITFGPGGFLYVALGDGGGGGDPEGNAQDLGSLLGKVLRIDPRPSGHLPYTVPADNPFVGQAGARGEIWSYGLRNPWRLSFDRQTGDLWIGDVGQSTSEEINVVAAPRAGAAANFGWPLREGDQRFSGPAPAGHVPPVHTYALDGPACAVTGGYVYRGEAIPDLIGTYLFADVCIGEVMGLRLGRDGTEVASLRISAPSLASFGEGPDGALYVLSLDGAISRIDPA